MTPVGREVSVASGSVDLLYLDNKGTLNLVEVKLDSNREVRRNVVGQILEYASQMINWDYDEIEERALAYASQLDSNLFSYLESQVGELDMERGEFEDRVVNQLQDGEIRLIVAVNNMVDTLRNIITFLNNYTTFEIYALQIDQYKAEEWNVYVPRLFGYKSKSHNGPSRGNWDEPSFFEEAENSLEADEFALLQSLFNLVDPSNKEENDGIEADEISWGTGVRRGSFNPIFHSIGGKSLFSAYSDGEINVNAGFHKGIEGLDRFLSDLEENISGVNIDESVTTHNVSFHISDLSGGLEEFTEPVKSFIERCSG